MTQTSNEKQKSPWFRQYWVETLIILGGFAAINFIFIFKAFRQSDNVSPEAASQLGAFVGGYIGSIFALTSVVLLFATLKSQGRMAEKQSFEAKYFELIKLHRENVSEIRVGKANGRKLFVLLIRELRCLLEVVRKVAAQLEVKLTARQEFHIGYYCLFFGVGPNSSRMLKISLSDFDANFVSAIEHELNQRETKKRVREESQFGYLPFEGHQSRLGHYYRHLYQMVRYVDLQKIDIDKYEYMKTIRAQLSTHEQALLLINSLTPIGQNWWKMNFIVTYRLVQNIPRDFFDSTTELNMDDFFGHGYFEWEEVG
jgi:Putative phage abortive infection protein